MRSISSTRLTAPVSSSCVARYTTPPGPTWAGTARAKRATTAALSTRQSETSTTRPQRVGLGQDRHDGRRTQRRTEQQQSGRMHPRARWPRGRELFAIVVQGGRGQHHVRDGIQPVEPPEVERRHERKVRVRDVQQEGPDERGQQQDRRHARAPGARTSHATAATIRTSPRGYALHTTAVRKLCVPAAASTTRSCHAATADATPKFAPSRNPSRQ